MIWFGKFFKNSNKIISFKDELASVVVDKRKTSIFEIIKMSHLFFLYLKKIEKALKDFF
jgi:hypothetical protein